MSKLKEATFVVKEIQFFEMNKEKTGLTMRSLFADSCREISKIEKFIEACRTEETEAFLEINVDIEESVYYFISSIESGRGRDRTVPSEYAKAINNFKGELLRAALLLNDIKFADD